ncbi:MAG TPA: MFS transporter [Chlamydiales bacterium]|nr:MFS transporter [Chlamydiales bacterium]
MTFALFALTICAFGIGCTEFVVIGILPKLAPEFQISIATAGSLVTWYAVAVIFGAPIMPALTAHIPRKVLLLLITGVFTIGNLWASVATSYEHLVGGRILTGLAHGTFYAIATNVAVQFATKDKQATALALMFSGVTAALVAGVPLGTFLASSFSWRVTFYVTTLLGTLGFLSVLFFVPNQIHYIRPKHLFRQFSILLQPKMLMAYAMTVLSFGGPFVAYTYIAATLRQTTGFGEYWIAPLLVLYGVAVAFGNIWGGKLADSKGAIHGLKYCVPAMVVVLLAFYFGQYSKIISVVLLIAWGALGYAIVPILQSFVITLAKYLQLEGLDVASGLNIAAFNLGIAGGSFVGGLVIDFWGLTMTFLAAGAVVLAAFCLICYTSKHLKHIK